MQKFCIIWLHRRCRNSALFGSSQKMQKFCIIWLITEDAEILHYLAHHRRCRNSASFGSSQKMRKFCIIWLKARKMQKFCIQHKSDDAKFLCCGRHLFCCYSSAGIVLQVLGVWINIPFPYCNFLSHISCPCSAHSFNCSFLV